MKLYLAGPMSGIEKFNFPAFYAAAAALRESGYDIVSPAEMDSDAVKAAAAESKDGKLDAEGKIAGETWGEILARDVRVIADTCDGIVFLDGWHKSRGARLEAFVALLSGKKEFYSFGQVKPNEPYSMNWYGAARVRGMIQANMP